VESEICILNIIVFRVFGGICKMMIKFALVIVYFIILFVVTRFLEFSGVFSRGMRCSEKCTGVQMLNTKQLQNVLDHRGINYRYVIERTELMSLVDNSGNLWLMLKFSLGPCSIVMLQIFTVLVCRLFSFLYGYRSFGRLVSG